MLLHAEGGRVSGFDITSYCGIRERNLFFKLQSYDLLQRVKHAVSVFRLIVHAAVQFPIEHNSVALKMRQRFLPNGQNNIITLQSVLSQETKLSSLS